MPDDLEAELDVKGEETVVEPDILEPEPEKAKPAPALTAADIAAAVAAAVAPSRVMTPEQQEQEWLRIEAESGQTRQVLEYNDRLRRETNLRENLPLYEQLGESKAKETLGAADKDLLVKVKEMMAKHPANVRANPQAWEDAAFLIKGKHGSATRPPKKDNEESGKVVGGAGGKVNPGLSEGRGGKPAGDGKKKEYTEMEQRIINTTCGGDAAKYEEYRSKDSTKPRDVKIEGTNRADLALQSLTRGVKL